jgi:5-methyltetrahydrofolate--homocysteine methyltransferase
MDNIGEIFDAIVAGAVAEVKEKVPAALEAGLDPTAILNEGMIAAMREVGARFETGEYFVPDMLLAARAMQAGLNTLKPHLPKSDASTAGKVVIGTVLGDIHDIGKNLVGLMLGGAGFTIIDLGTNVAPEQFVKAVRERGPDILALSALLTTTMLAMKTTIEALKEAGLRDKVKVVVGGAPITEAYALKIGADGFAPDASRAVALVNALVKDRITA